MGVTLERLIVANRDPDIGSAQERHSAKDARAHSWRAALVTIERVCAHAQELRIDGSSRLVKVSEIR